LHRVLKGGGKPRVNKTGDGNEGVETMSLYLVTEGHQRTRISTGNSRLHLGSGGPVGTPPPPQGRKKEVQQGGRLGLYFERERVSLTLEYTLFHTPGEEKGVVLQVAGKKVVNQKGPKEVLSEREKKAIRQKDLL